MTSPACDVVVLGAGIVGAAVALECAREHMQVAIVEPDVIGGGATAAGMGHIVVMDDSEAQFALTRYSQQLWQAVAAELPADVEYMACGTVWVAADEEEMLEVRRKHEYYKARGVATEILDAVQLRTAEPNLREGLAGGLLVPGDSVIYSPCAARFLLQQARALGAQAGCRSSRRGAATERSGAERRPKAGREVHRERDGSVGGFVDARSAKSGCARDISSSPIAIPAMCGINWWSWAT